MSWWEQLLRVERIFERYPPRWWVLTQERLTYEDKHGNTHELPLEAVEGWITMCEAAIVMQAEQN